MPDTLEFNRSLGNGRDGPPDISVRGGVGLGNTNPIATLGSTFGSGAPSVVPSEPQGGSWRSKSSPEFVRQAESGADVVYRLEELWVIAQVKHWRSFVNVARARPKVLKPTGPVVLFQKIMEDWGFSDQDAATLLGFEAAADIGQIYAGVKPVGHRDANDRLRAVLRIAADLDALFQDVGAIRDWLSEPQRDLDESTPRSLLAEGSMENLLRVRYYVAYLSGR